MPEFVLDIAMLGAELNRIPLTIIGHSLGGAVSLQYTGTFPQFVRKVVAIEGLGPPVREPTPASHAHAHVDEGHAAVRARASHAATPPSTTPFGA